MDGICIQFVQGNRCSIAPQLRLVSSTWPDLGKKGDRSANFCTATRGGYGSQCVCLKWKTLRDGEGRENASHHFNDTTTPGVQACQFERHVKSFATNLSYKIAPMKVGERLGARAFHLSWLRMLVPVPVGAERETMACPISFARFQPAACCG